MKFVPLARGGVVDDYGTEGCEFRNDGDVAIRAGETDIIISYRAGMLSIKTYAVGDLENVWEHIYMTDTQMAKWREDIS